jgi:CheY-like chemotaxis protein
MVPEMDGYEVCRRLKANEKLENIQVIFLSALNETMDKVKAFAVTEGKLDLGPWEQIFYGEFDGRRRKRVLVKIIGE